MSVRAKMKCEMNENGDVLLRPVVGGSNENDQYYKYTPGGECQLSILNEAASSQFEVGKEYYVTFEQA